MASIWSLVIQVVCIAVFFGLLYLALKFVYNVYKKSRALKAFPGMPGTHWFRGDLDLLRRMFASEKEVLQFFDYVKENNFKVTKQWVGPYIATLNIHHCSLVPKVLKLPKNKIGYDFLRPWLGDGLLISEGNKWHRNRRLLTPAFHYQILSPYISVYNSSLDVMFKKWSLSAKLGEPVMLFDSISLLSLDIILKCSFSFNSDCQVSKEKHPYINGVQELVEMISQRFVNLFHRIDWIYRLTAAGKKFYKTCKMVHDYSALVIQNRKKELGIGTESISESELRARKKGKYLDFLDVLLIARDEEGNGLTDQEIQDECDTFLFEGHDTTTSGMCWTLYCLAKYPEHQEKVREEVASVLMGREQLEYEDLKGLKYTQWCIKEAMRLYPPVFFISREATEGFEIDGHVIPTGVRIGLNIRSIQRHPDTWENPSVYDPLRFHPSNCEGRDPFAYIPFSGGQRNCIGQNFALNEEKVVIGSIVSKFKLSLVEGHNVESSPLIVLRSTDDIKVKLTPLWE